MLILFYRAALFVFIYSWLYVHMLLFIIFIFVFFTFLLFITYFSIYILFAVLVNMTLNNWIYLIDTRRQKIPIGMGICIIYFTVIE